MHPADVEGQVRALKQEGAELNEDSNEHEARVDGERHESRREDLFEDVAVGQLHQEA